MAKTVELHAVWETVSLKLGLDTACAAMVFGFISFVLPGKYQ
jgi:hypothetical protein